MVGYKYLRFHKGIHVNVNKGKRLPGEVLTPEEVQLLLASFPASRTGVRNRAIAALGLYASLRCFEILNLYPGDIDLEKCSVLVRNGKGGKTARVGISRAAKPYIMEWRELRPESAQFFICTHKGEQVSTAYVREMLPRQSKKAGIRHRVHCHSFRHTSAVLLMRAGTPLVVISRQLRHSSIAVTNTYLQHVNPEEVISAVRDLIF